MEQAKDELRGIMRRLRRLGPEKKDDFDINSQQIIREQIDPIKQKIALAGLFITGLALFVGAIGIMNITYVSVKERTKEIGTARPWGAPSHHSPSVSDRSRVNLRARRSAATDDSVGDVDRRRAFSCLRSRWFSRSGWCSLG